MHGIGWGNWCVLGRVGEIRVMSVLCVGWDVLPFTGRGYLGMVTVVLWHLE